MSKRKAFFCFVLVMCILLLLCILCIFYSYYAQPPKNFKTKTVVISQGDTLWRIAQRERPNGNIQELVYYIREVNSIKDPGSLQPGQEILVPVLDGIK